MNTVVLPVLTQPANVHFRPAYQRPVLSIVRDVSTLQFRRAQPADAVAVHALQQDFVAEGLLLPRSLEQVYRSIRDYTLAVQDDQVVGCAALRIYSAELAEIGALAVAAHMQGAGVGRRLVEALLRDARALGLRRVFALTLQDAFFTRIGFRTTSISEFPAKAAADCASCARRHACNEIAVDVLL